MAAGGKRKGAGRKAGAVTTKTREIAETAIKQGITPLEVMLNVMREAWVDSQNVIVTDAGDKKANEAKAKAIREMYQNRAISAANDAAPYIHPKLAPVDAKTGETARFVIIDPCN